MKGEDYMPSTYNLINSFSIKKLGRLEHAPISIKPLTIMCGKNHTGKTWLMYSIYGFLKNKFNKLENMNSILRDLKEKGTLNFNLSEWIEENHEYFIKHIEDKNKNNLSNVFNSNPNLFKNTSFSWSVNLNTLKNNISKYEVNINFNLGLEKDVLFIASKESDTECVHIVSKNLPDSLVENIISSIIYESCFGICRENQKNVFLIPAERNGLHLFFRELSSNRTNLLHTNNIKKLKENSYFIDALNTKYSQPIADYIDWLNNLYELNNKEKRSESDPLYTIVKEIERLVEGTFKIDENGSISFIPELPKQESSSSALDLHLSSSTTKSLCGLYFYLEYQAQVNDTIMLDEPELNLHPSNQRAMARIVASLVNSGINVILSTHSDYFIREINSLIMLSDAQGDQSLRTNLMTKYSISDNHLIDKDKIGAYLFTNDIVELMEITKEGIIATTFDEEINLLNESSDDIYYSYIEPIYTDCKTTS